MKINKSINKKIRRRIWWLQHKKKLILLSVTVIGALIFSFCLAYLLLFYDY